MHLYRLVTVWLCCWVVAGFSVGVVRSGEGPLAQQDQVHVAEIRALIAEHGSDVWPGWGEDVPPLLIQSGDNDVLIGHPSPPDGFELVPDMVIDGARVYWMAGHLIPQPVATAWQVGDVWVATAPARDDFQAILDEYLGAGVVELTDAEYIRSVVHEAFHAFQLTVRGGPENLPLFGMESDAMAWFDTVQEDDWRVLNVQYAAEGEALRAALEAETDTERLEEAVRFLELRALRRADMPRAIVPFEQYVEWAEGTARYADVSMMVNAGAADVAPTAVDYRPADAIWREFLDQLADPAAIPGTVRDRYYVLGAGMAFLLDALDPEWKTDFLVSEELSSLEDLLADAVFDE